MDSSAGSIAILILIVLLAVWIAVQFFYGRRTFAAPAYILPFTDSSGSTVPKATDVAPVTVGFQDKKEGFYGGAARGTGASDCSRSSLEGAQLLSLFEDKAPAYEEGSDALRELTVLIGKLSCFKKDLVSPSRIVEATRYQEFMTVHDIEPIAETTGRCFAKTIGPRDFTLAFDKWTARGQDLVKKLCTAYRLNPEEVKRAQALFSFLVRDVQDIARGVCLAGEPSIAGKPGPRDAHPFEDPRLQEFGEYTGYY
jgi:hypothetical protein